MNRMSNTDCHAVVKVIEGHAKTLDLLPPDGELDYIPGSPTQGHAPGVGVTVHTSRNGKRYLASGLALVPTFPRGRLTTSTEAWGILSATCEALAAVVNHTNRSAS